MPGIDAENWGRVSSWSKERDEFEGRIQDLRVQ